MDRKRFDTTPLCNYNVITQGGALIMKSKIVKIGNSRGIRIPKPLIEEAGLGEEVEIQVEGNRLIIAPAGRVRVDWAASFQKMARRDHDALMDDDVPVPTKWEEDEWEWQ